MVHSSRSTVPASGFIRLQDDREQGGFARAIRPDQRDALAVVHRHRRRSRRACARRGYFLRSRMVSMEKRVRTVSRKSPGNASGRDRVIPVNTRSTRRETPRSAAPDQRCSPCARSRNPACPPCAGSLESERCRLALPPLGEGHRIGGEKGIVARIQQQRRDADAGEIAGALERSQ